MRAPTSTRRGWCKAVVVTSIGVVSAKILEATQPTSAPFNSSYLGRAARVNEDKVDICMGGKAAGFGGLGPSRKGHASPESFRIKINHRPTHFAAFAAHQDRGAALTSLLILSWILSL